MTTKDKFTPVRYYTEFDPYTYVVDNRPIQDLTNNLNTVAAEVDGVQARLDEHASDSTYSHDASTIGNTPAGNIVSPTVQDAINELDAEKAGLSLANVFTQPQTVPDGTVTGHAVNKGQIDNLKTEVQTLTDEAKAARDAAVIQAGVYVDEPTGRAAVLDGEAFKVQGSEDIAAYEYRRVDSTSSTLIAVYPSASYVTDIRNDLPKHIVLEPNPVTPLIEDRDGRVAMGVEGDGSIRVNLRLSADSIGVREGEVSALDEFSDLAYAVVDRNNKVAFGVTKEGTAFADVFKTLSASSQEPTTNSTSSTIDFSELAYAVVDKNDKVGFGVTVYGSIFYDSTFGEKTEPTIRHPQSSETFGVSINHFLMNGQSLSIRGGDSLNRYDDNDKTFSGGLYLQTEEVGNTLVPAAYDSSSVVIWNALQQMKFLIAGGALYTEDPNYNNDYQTLVSSHGTSGAMIEDLSKGGTTGSYEDAMFGVSEGVRLADASAKSYALQALNWIQGESNRGDTASKYMTTFNAMLSTYRADISAATGQPNDFPTFVYQLSGNQYDQPVGVEVANTIADAFFQLSESDPKIIIATPTYWITHYDALHFDNPGGLAFGMAWGKALYKVVYRGEDWRPLEPRRISQYNARTIVIKFHVPEPPLVFDIENVVNPGNYGFDVRDSVGVAAIASVEIINGDSVCIRLARDLGTSPVVSYAYYGVGGNGGGPTTGARGNLRDSDPTVGVNGFAKLWNWCTVFNKSVPYTKA